MKLKGTIEGVSNLTHAQKERMLFLMESYYDNVSGHIFERDLQEKDGVLLVYDAENILQGFSTYMLYEIAPNGENVHILFSGDTIIDRACWGQVELFRLFVRLAFRLLREGRSPLYWLLISKGVRTYLLLPQYYKSFYPNHELPTPSDVQGIIDAAAEMKFGEMYRRSEGTVKAGRDSDRMKPEIDTISERRLQDPHVRFFLERNPGYKEGDELVCIAKIAPENFRRAFLRFAKPKR